MYKTAVIEERENQNNRNLPDEAECKKLFDDFDARHQLFGLFNLKEEAILKNSCKLLTQQPKEVITSMFIKLFQLHPDFKSCFPATRHLNDMDLFSSTELIDHADMFLKSTNNLVYSLDKPKDYFEELNKAAVAHERTNIKRFHIDAFFTILITTMCEFVTISEEEYQAWKKLFDSMNLYQDILRSGLIKSSRE